MPKKIVLLGTVVSSLLGFRADLIRLLVSDQHEVYVFGVDFSESSRQSVRELGAIPVDYSLSRAGINPFADISAALQLRKLLAKIQPDVVFSYFVKPVIYGSIAARLASVPSRMAMLEGLGYVFTDLPSGLGFKQKLLRSIQVMLYRLALPFIDHLIFLNPDDPVDLLQRHGLKAKRVSILGGIGLNFNDFPYSTVQVEPLRFLFIGRLLAEKGINEYVEAARIVKAQYPLVEFVVLGGLDEKNPGGLKQKELQKLLDDGVIVYPGHVSNVAEWIADCSVFVLPSYREGVPRSTQEAMAIGRAVLTSDVPGCRETVIDGVNGFLVPRWNAQALAEKMFHLIDNPQEIARMGRESHRIALEKFDAEKVNRRLIQLMSLDESDLPIIG